MFRWCGNFHSGSCPVLFRFIFCLKDWGVSAEGEQTKQLRKEEIYITLPFRHTWFHPHFYMTNLRLLSF